MSSINDPQNSEKELLNTIEEKEKIFSEKAILVHKNRVLYAKKLANNIERAMFDLNMPGSRFEILIKQEESQDGFVKFDNKLFHANPQGIDNIEFYLSANKGEPTKPLASIASGCDGLIIEMHPNPKKSHVDPLQPLNFSQFRDLVKKSKKVANSINRKI